MDSPWEVHITPSSEFLEKVRRKEHINSLDNIKKEHRNWASLPLEFLDKSSKKEHEVAELVDFNV